MGNGAFSFVVTNWQNAMLISLILFSLYSALQIIDDKSLETFANSTNTSVYEKTGEFGVWAISLNALTPTFRYSLPFTNNYYIGINDIPFFDSTDLFVIILLTTPLIFILRRKKIGKSKTSDILWKLLILIIYIGVAFIMSKIFVYYVYLWASSKIGLSETMAIAVREKLLLTMAASGTLFYLTSGLGFISALKGLFVKK